MQNAEQIECRMQSAECRVIEFRVGDDLPGIPKNKRIFVCKKQPVGERLGAPENERLSYVKTGEV